MMLKIFISYSHVDSEFAQTLHNDLKIIGHDPWLDSYQITPGDSIVTKVQNGLRESSFMIVVLSNSALKSKWVDEEWKEKYWDAAQDRKIKIIPVRCEECDLPIFLRTKQYADFAKSYAVGFASLCTAIRTPFSSPTFPNDFIPENILNAIEHEAENHHNDHIRLACAHTVWSLRPDLAKRILERAQRDWSEVVRNHAKALLEGY
jgi:hypothetical protein